MSNLPQNYVIDGVKFFKSNLDKLKYNSMLTDNPITTSEISVYIILHLYADEMGQIRSLTTNTDVSDRRQLCISNIAKEHDLTYETVKKAFDSLIERGYVAEVYTEKSMYYELVNYAKLNSNTEETLNYFRIPYVLFHEKVFGDLIKHRFHTGPIVILELCQYFTRQIGTNRKLVKDIQAIQGTRTMDYLKKSLHTTAQRVRKFLEIISGVFLFKPVSQEVKEPSPTRLKRVREFIQVCIKKYTFSLNPNCFKENEKLQEKQSFAAAKKEMAARIKYANLPIKWRDILDINKSVSRIVKTASHLHIVNKSKDLIRYSVVSVADTLEELHRDGKFQSIKSIGAFVNKLFSNAWDEYQLKNITEGERLDIINQYMRVYGEAPPFLK